ncbi:hypothetical protein JVX90_14795 [Gordonia sp. PDNC005]|uniref:hypothetical protein n=1 Tax=unclassified Gordonia (in: high G+C Gram-positive bacteria) TaxID=2657482 RepID=UPI001962C44E|nr:hypothetical protein [Gordonia sp. PDNC005]QRY61673.1 hypothetical protein JVX90_14795 [Gordonia sp. PDNC005]
MTSARGTTAAVVTIGALVLSGCSSNPDPADGTSTHSVVPTSHAPAAAGTAQVHVRFDDPSTPLRGFTVIDRGRNGVPSFRVHDGLLVHGAPEAPGAALYTSTSVAADAVTRIGATVRFPDGGTSGAIALLVGAHPVPKSEDDPAPSAAVHFVADPDGWSYAVWPEGTRAQDVLARGRYRSPIEKSSARFEVQLVGSTVTVLLPDDTAVTLTDPRIGTYRGPVATWELYEATPDLKPAAFAELWAG